MIGIDFDNTLVCYDRVLAEIAQHQGLVPADLPLGKGSVRDYLRSHGQEDRWTELQGTLYGPALAQAEPFAGVREFLQACHDRGIRIAVISHKTRHPFRGPAFDLHRAAWDWLERNHFLGSENSGVAPENVFLELTKADKLRRIAACACTHFIDDLPEFLCDPDFPAPTMRIWFDPEGRPEQYPMLLRLPSWRRITESLLGTSQTQTLAWTS